jgi:hypothetical protein
MKKNIKTFLSALPVYALDLHNITTGPDTPTGQVMNAIGGANKYETGQSIIVYIGNIIAVALGFLGAYMVGLIIYAGFIWMNAGGDKEKITSAQGHLRNAVIGAILVISAWTITAFVLNALGGAATAGG